ncbi:uncharacterized protein Dvar_78820 [Desulfosarcina variabilis str. Montpellier]
MIGKHKSGAIWCKYFLPPPQGHSGLRLANHYILNPILHKKIILFYNYQSFTKHCPVAKASMRICRY